MSKAVSQTTTKKGLSDAVISAILVSAFHSDYQTKRIDGNIRAVRYHREDKVQHQAIVNINPDTGHIDLTMKVESKIEQSATGTISDWTVKEGQDFDDKVKEVLKDSIEKQNLAKELDGVDPEAIKAFLAKQKK